MFVYIIGNTEQNVFKLGIASDPFLKLSSLQEGNPYKLSILCKLCVDSKNEASLVEQRARKELSQYEGIGKWYTTVPNALSTQLTSEYYLRLMASRVNVKPSNFSSSGLRQRTQKTASKGRTALQRLTSIAKRSGLSFEDVLEKVKQAYGEGTPVDSFFEDII